MSEEEIDVRHEFSRRPDMGDSLDLARIEGKRLPQIVLTISDNRRMRYTHLRRSINVARYRIPKVNQHLTSSFHHIPGGTFVVSAQELAVLSNKDVFYCLRTGVHAKIGIPFVTPKRNALRCNAHVP